jgi:DNA polymerase III epsilon subunit-like protein
MPYYTYNRDSFLKKPEKLSQGLKARGIITKIITMKLLLLDTETNGLPTNRYAPPSCTEAFPAILQLSWSLFTVAGAKSLRLEESRDRSIALPPEVPYNAGAGAIHGISEAAARQGCSALEAFTELAEVFKRVDCIVAHNLSFDRPVLRAAAYAVGLRDLWPPSSKVQEFCTMREMRDLCCLGGGSVEGVYKLPSLNELYNFLYGHVYDVSGAKLHSSRSDTHCLGRCVEGLLRRGALTVSGSRLVASYPSSASSVSPLVSGSPAAALCGPSSIPA